MQSIESNCIWYTGFTDGFLCFELLENSHYPEIDYAHTLVLQELSIFRRLTDEYIFNESIVKYCLNWLIDKIEMVEKDKFQEEYSKYNLQINSAFKDEPFESMVELFESYLHDEKYFIRLHINEDKIRTHLNNCMSEWRQWRFFNNWRTPRNILTAKKQEEQIVNKLTKIEEEGYDMKNYILNLKELLEWSPIEKWINDNEKDEPELSINPFLTLWSLQDKWFLKIQFWSTNLMVLDDPIYRIEMTTKDKQLQNILKDWWTSETESTDKIRVNLNLDSENIVKITPYISYDPENQEFLNPRNWAKCKLKEEYSRQIIELLISKNEQNVIRFVEDNKIILSEYKKWKRWWWKWDGMHTFLQSKIKNIWEKIESQLWIKNELRTSFLSCTKEFIAIKVLHK